MSSSSQISAPSGLLPSISLPDNVSDLFSKLPSASTLLAVGGAAVAGYVALEQLRFSWWAKDKQGKPLPGG